MNELKKLLETIDEQYLIGLANKGIVNRAHKDLEQSDISMNFEGDNLIIKVDDAVCTILSPLGNSKCTCPSRSICKHIIMAILYAKRKFESEAGREENREDNSKDKSEDKSITQEDENGKNAAVSAFASLKDYPIDKIKRVLGDKNFQNLYHRIKAGIWPDITVTSIITVHFKEAGITVKLLEPLEHSSCSCHKKEICRHKAEALVYYKLKEGTLTIKDLEERLENIRKYDIEEVKILANDMKRLIAMQLVSGLTRTSPAVMDSFERMAVMCHNHKLADFERDYREVAEEYRLYFARNASFKAAILMNKVLKLYRKADLLSKAQTIGDISFLAGEMRSEYLPVGRLSLMGMGQRYFSSKTGYEGETYYFIEENSQEWYTYTNARPVFYERKRSISDKGPAPWGLPCTLEELETASFVLIDPKASADNRLSSTSEARGELTGKRQLKKESLHKQYYEDFAELFEKLFASAWQTENGNMDISSKLVLVQPASFKNAVFNTIKQEFSMELYDRNDYRLLLKVSYSSVEHYTIRYLERLAKRMERGSKGIPCFFGSIYLSEGMMKLYPINYYEQEEWI